MEEEEGEEGEGDVEEEEGEEGEGDNWEGMWWVYGATCSCAEEINKRITAHSLVHLPSSEPLHLRLVAVLNPLDPGLQKWAHLLQVLQVATQFDIQVYLNPRGKLAELPIKRYI